jgi:Matrixin
VNARALAFSLAAVTLAFAAQSSAYCRSTTCCRSSTCNSDQVTCEYDDSACLASGKPLFWASACLQVEVQARGSVSQGIDFDAADQSVKRAFGAWLAADCAGQRPLLEVQVLGPISCATAQYNSTKKNANIVFFREDEWPYVGGEDTLGFTHVTFDTETGEIWDADIELNAVEGSFSVGDPVTGADLDSVLTHEAGHLLGFDHTLVKEATMFGSYVPGTDTLRTLAEDDRQAICAAYPPDRIPNRTSCAPRHGFSNACAADQPENSATNEGTGQGDSTTSVSKGCAVEPPDKPGERGSFWWASLAVFAIYQRRSRFRLRSRTWLLPKSTICNTPQEVTAARRFSTQRV